MCYGSVQFLVQTQALINKTDLLKKCETRAAYSCSVFFNNPTTLSHLLLSTDRKWIYDEYKMASQKEENNGGPNT
jgi:hypothetical protein